jgi:D-alanine-D-alanine ligase
MEKTERVLLLLDVGESMPTEYKYYNELKTDDWITENDIIKAIRNLGYERDLLGVFGDIGVIQQKIESYQPTIIFNQVEAFKNSLSHEQHIAAVLELCGVPFTGCGSTGITLCKHKGISKKILGYHRIRVPDFAVMAKGKPLKRPSRLKFPIFVKPLKTEASFGIAQASLVVNEAQFKQRVAFVHEKFNQDAIAEEYIEGRELYVSILGNEDLQVFPIREIKFKEVPEGEPKFASYKAKWDYDYRDRWGIVNEFAEHLDPALVQHIEKTCRKIYSLLAIEGYARLDLRLTSNNEIVFLEANPNPHLAGHEDFARSARRGGVTFPNLIDRIIQLGKSAKRD